MNINEADVLFYMVMGTRFEEAVERSLPTEAQQPHYNKMCILFPYFLYISAGILQHLFFTVG